MDRKPKNMGYGMVIPRWSSHHRTKRFPASPQSAEAMGDLQAVPKRSFLANNWGLLGDGIG